MSGPEQSDKSVAKEHNQLDSLSMCKSTPEAVSAWLNTLPRSNIREFSRELLKICNEIPRLNLPIDKCQALLDCVRQQTSQICLSLSRVYLNQPLSLPESASAAFSLSQKLQHVIADGYAQLAERHAIDMLEKPHNRYEIEDHATVVCIHRAIAEFSPMLLRVAQLYMNTPKGVWARINRLFQLATSNEVADFAVGDPLTPHHTKSSIRDIYKANLLLSLARTNQLNQSEIYESWLFLLYHARDIKLETPVEGQHTFYVDLNSDDAAIVHASRAPIRGHDKFGIYTQDLLIVIKKNLQPNERSTAPEGPMLTQRLNNHLYSALRGQTLRAFPRRPANFDVRVCLGLAATSFFCAENNPLSHLVHRSSIDSAATQQDQNPFMKTTRASLMRDVWDQPYNPNIDATNDQHARKILEEIKRIADLDDTGGEEKYEPVKLRAIEFSANGFHLAWQGAVPATLRIGQVCGFLEEGMQHWGIGVIRWVGHGDSETHIGVEILSPAGATFGIRQIPASGAVQETAFGRALLLPPIPVRKIPARILTAALPFGEGDRVQLLNQDVELRLRLTNRTEGSMTYNIFEYKSNHTAPSSVPPFADIIDANDDIITKMWKLY